MTTPARGRTRHPDGPSVADAARYSAGSGGRSTLTLSKSRRGSRSIDRLVASALAGFQRKLAKGILDRAADARSPRSHRFAAHADALRVMLERRMVGDSWQQLKRTGDRIRPTNHFPISRGSRLSAASSFWL